ncbi:hypothetical protein [Rhizobium leguminosarum]|uniref:hypothetical protein n=1 Tax=Rhizobium leguminosarum TaxID=384 RepID=UPI00144152EB|nr:hypothetical protein [Rhizobium leguminosarum]NKL59719.1 hypothetical protein [Rhizobium leguminosarum bv. viciae]
MTKINHNRPTLRLLDNYRRELRSQAHEYSSSETASEILVSGRNKKMPGVSQSAQEIILSMFDAAGRYLEAFSKILKTLSLDAGKSLRKKRASFQQEMEDAKSDLIDVCVKLVVEALREKIEGKKGVVEWLTWFQDEAQRTNDYGLLDILEIGIKPAFQKLDAAIEEGAFRQGISSAGP